MRASVSTACFVPSEAACIVVAMQTPLGLSVSSQDLVAAARVQ